MIGVALAVLGGLAALLALLGVRELVVLARQRRRVVGAAELGDPSEPGGVFRGWDRRFRKTRPGRWLVRELDLAGLSVDPLVVALAGALVAVAVTLVIWVYLAPVLALAGIGVGFLAVRLFLRRAQSRRQEAIVTQMPELARVLANASHAGLSLPTALTFASSELPEPSRSEVTRIAQQVRFGAPLEHALQDFRDRVRSREAGVLISTLIVSSRSGGSLVTALRGIATSLEQRKETRRQIRTTLSGPTATADMLVLIGVAMLLILNVVQPGTVEKMTQSPLGIAGLVISFVLFTVGVVVVRRMTRIEH